MQPTNQHFELLPYGRPLNPLFAPNARFNLTIAPKIEAHNDHERRYRQQMAWDAFKQRVTDGSFAREYRWEHSYDPTPRSSHYLAPKEPKPGSGMVDDESGIGIFDNQVILVDKDAPPFKPTIVDDDGNVVEGDPDAAEEA